MNDADAADSKARDDAPSEVAGHTAGVTSGDGATAAEADEGAAPVTDNPDNMTMTSAEGKGTDDSGEATASTLADDGGAAASVVSSLPAPTPAAADDAAADAADDDSDRYEERPDTPPPLLSGDYSQVLNLGAAGGTELLVYANGPNQRPAVGALVTLVDNNAGYEPLAELRIHVWEVTGWSPSMDTCWIVRTFDRGSHGIIRSHDNEAELAHGGQWKVVREAGSHVWQGQQVGTWDAGQHNVAYIGHSIAKLFVRQHRPKVGAVVRFIPTPMPKAAPAPTTGSLGALLKGGAKGKGKMASLLLGGKGSAGIALKLGAKWKKKAHGRDVEGEVKAASDMVWDVLRWEQDTDEKTSDEPVSDEIRLKTKGEGQRRSVTLWSHGGGPHALVKKRVAMAEALARGGRWHVLSPDEVAEVDADRAHVRAAMSRLGGDPRKHFSGASTAALEAVIADPDAPPMGPRPDPYWGELPPERFCTLIRLHNIEDGWSVNDECPWGKSLALRSTPTAEVFDMIVWNSPSSNGIHLYWLGNEFDASYCDRAKTVGAWVAYRESFCIAHQPLPPLRRKTDKLGNPLVNVESCSERSEAVRVAMIEFAKLIRTKSPSRYVSIRAAGRCRTGWPCGLFDNLMSPKDSALAAAGLRKEWRNKLGFVDLCGHREPSSYMAVARMYANDVFMLVASDAGTKACAFDVGPDPTGEPEAKKAEAERERVRMRTAWETALVTHMDGGVDNALVDVLRATAEVAAERWELSRANAAKRRLRQSIVVINLEAVEAMLKFVVPRAAAVFKRLRDEVESKPAPTHDTGYGVIIVLKRPHPWQPRKTHFGDAKWAISTLPPIITPPKPETEESKAGAGRRGRPKRRRSVLEVKADEAAEAKKSVGLVALFDDAIATRVTNANYWDWGTTGPAAELRAEREARATSGLQAQRIAQAEVKRLTALGEAIPASVAAAAARAGGHGGSASEAGAGAAPDAAPSRSRSRGKAGRRASTAERAFEKAKAAAIARWEHDREVPADTCNGIMLRHAESMCLESHEAFMHWLCEDEETAVEHWPLPLIDAKDKMSNYGIR